MSINILENQDLRIQINSMGAEMQSFFDVKNNNECLWQADPNYWARRAPVLFPIVGRLANDELIHKNKKYPMTQHGFARDSEFTLIKETDTSIALSLTSNENTLKQYPFNFELVIEYHLDANKLTTTYIIRNPNKETLPASIGAHPAFNWPLKPSSDKNKHYIQFEKDETNKIRRLENGLLLQEKIENPIVQKKIHLTDTLFEHDALIFDKLKSREIVYSASNDLSITVRFEDFPHLGIWTKPGAPFICLEPWQGHSSPIDFDGEFSEKPGILLIPAQSEIKRSFEILLN